MANITVTMTDNRIGEDGSLWESGTSYSATEAYARELVQFGWATATFEEPTLGWDDLRFPAQGINPPGPTGAPGRNTDDGLLDFDADATETIAGCAQLPHSWLRASTIKPHVHLKYRNAAAGNSVWKFEYDIANVNSSWSGSYTPSTKTHVGPASTTKHAILSFDEIDMTGYKESCCILWKLSRVGDDEADTFAYDVALVEFDIHYIRGKDGTTYELPT